VLANPHCGGYAFERSHGRRLPPRHHIGHQPLLYLKSFSLFFSSLSSSQHYRLADRGMPFERRLDLPQLDAKPS
jgi:hypothetical protein